MLQAHIGSVTLPCQFSYKPAVPSKRKKVVQTAGGIRIHTAPTIVAGDSSIGWDIQAATRAEYVELLTLFNDPLSPDLSFTGYWGDAHTVKFLIFDSPKAYAAGLFDVSGSFQIISTSSWGTAV